MERALCRIPETRPTGLVDVAIGSLLDQILDEGGVLVPLYRAEQLRDRGRQAEATRMTVQINEAYAAIRKVREEHGDRA